MPLIRELFFDKTCAACPEQYDVYDSADNIVGYVRLRHGRFTVAYVHPNEVHDIVYDANTQSDGVFNGSEREFYLNKAVDALLEKIDSLKPVVEPEEKKETEDVENS